MTKRYTSYQSVALKTDATSPEIDISNYASGEVVVPSGELYVTLTYFVAQPSGTYYTAYDATPAAISQTVVAGRAYPIPSALFGAGIIQVRANANGNVGIILKS